MKDDETKLSAALLIRPAALGAAGLIINNSTTDTVSPKRFL
jgi:hypothetical protein